MWHRGKKSAATLLAVETGARVVINANVAVQPPVFQSLFTADEAALVAARATGLLVRFLSAVALCLSASAFGS